jgi:hypothetical protein
MVSVKEKLKNHCEAIAENLPLIQNVAFKH